MNAKTIAQAVKQHLIQLAADDKLPMDMTLLDESALETVIQKELPTEQDEAIEKASHYLCDDDVEAAIKAIAAHPDQNAYIDDVDDVTVWEKVQFSFSCAEFLSHIDWVE